MSIEEDYLSVDRGDATYVGEFGHRLNPPVSIHISIWCVMEFPVQWDVVIDILGLFLGLVNNEGRNEEFPISLGKYK